MKFYRQSILLYGLLLPLIVGVLLLVIGYYFKANTESVCAKNIVAYNNSEKDRKDCLTIEGKVLPERPAMERWEKLLSEKIAPTMGPQLREIMAGFSKSELQETSSTPSLIKAGFGVVSEQNSSQMQINFRGTFSAMQDVLIKLETKFPQLHVNELKIDPVANQSSLLDFKISYTAWENK